jgi:hypothetical protein
MRPVLVSRRLSSRRLDAERLHDRPLVVAVPWASEPPQHGPAGDQDRAFWGRGGVMPHPCSRRHEARTAPVKRVRSGSMPNRSQYDLMTGSAHMPAWS